MKRFAHPIVLFGCLLFVGLPVHAQTDDVVVGINSMEQEGSKDSSVEERQNATLRDLKAAGVRVIRNGIGADDKGLDYVKRVYAQGIKILWILPLKYPSNAPVRPWQPREFPGMWAGPPLSYSDPELFRAYVQPLLDKLEGMGIQLAGFELGNELNMTAFNGEFPLPGKGRQFALNDLYHDPEAQQIAKGYLQYLKSLAVLKDIRDHSKLNRHTPILTAGFGAYEAPEGPFPPPAKPSTQVDLVSVNATIEFLRTNGLDKLVDAYAVHVYPWANGPGQPAAAAGRQARLARFVLAECRPAGSADGKPCWITEWGFKNKDTSCPVHESDQVALIREMKNNFLPYVQQRKLLGLFYYAWVDTRENFGVFRCGSLTQSGRLAIAPFATTEVSAAQAEKVVVGVNTWYRPPSMSPEEMLQHLSEEGVKTIRMGLVGPDTTSFIIQAYQHGIGTVAIVYPFAGSKAKSKGGWAQIPLSELKPQEFTEGFKPMLDKLEASGVRLTAVELGNEINTSRFNGDIPAPGSGRVLGISDLNNPEDPEAAAVARGYRVYLQVMAALKELRDHSKVNKTTPILSGASGNWGVPAPKSWNKEVGVSHQDSIEFLRQNGMDKLVDGYAVHVYPDADPSRSVATRTASLGETIFAECTETKPCWLTEWGIPDGSPGGVPEHCPVDETKRIKVIEELRGAFQHFVSEKRLSAIIFYDWADKPGNTGAIFRCGGLTDAGKLALRPM